MTAWIQVNTSKQVGGRDHLKDFTSEDAASEWFRDNDRVPRPSSDAASRFELSPSLPASMMFFLARHRSERTARSVGPAWAPSETCRSARGL